MKFQSLIQLPLTCVAYVLTNIVTTIKASISVCLVNTELQCNLI